MILGFHLLARVSPPSRNVCSVMATSVGATSSRKIREPHLDLVNVNLSVLLLQLLVCLFHGIHCCHRIAQVLSGERGRLHVECLLSELRQLRLIHALLLESTKGALLYRVLCHEKQIGLDRL